MIRLGFISNDISILYNSSIKKEMDNPITDADMEKESREISNIKAEMEGQEQNSLEQDSKGGTLYCVCRSSDASKFMIGCDGCGEWFHGDCVEIRKEDAKHIQLYHCSMCVEKNDSLQSIVYKKKYLKERQRQKEEENFLATMRCGECIGCFRPDDCGKCEGCEKSNNCVKRQCVQAEYLLQRKGVISRPRRENLRTTSADESEGALSPLQPPSPEKEKGRGVAKRVGGKMVHMLLINHEEKDRYVIGTQITKKDVVLKYTIQLKYVIVNFSRNSYLDFTTELIRSSYQTYTRLRSNKAHAKKANEPRHCLGLECTRSAREGSKYCSDECGKALAEARLRLILPQRVEEFWKGIPRTEVRAAEQIDQIDNTVTNIQIQVERLLGYVKMIQQYINAIKHIDPIEEDDGDLAEFDSITSCTVCGVEYSAKQLPKHIERCFVRSEKQITFGTPFQAPVNPDLLFCEFYNKANNTYCKRLRVICAEHYKGDLENDMKRSFLIKDFAALLEKIACNTIVGSRRFHHLRIQLHHLKKHESSSRRFSIAVIKMSRTVLVFDVDGTLSPARRKISPEMRAFLEYVRKRVPLVVVGGSDLDKITEQLADGIDDLFSQFDFIFAENGLIGFKGKEQYPSQTIQNHIGEEKLQTLINFTLRYFSDIKLPVKRGNFVEFRKGMLNLSPIGRSCSQAERDEFVVFDREHKVREKFLVALEKNFADYGLSFAIGGQISVDVYPVGWDKTYCLQYFENDFDTIHFFGDKTMPGGNDYTIFTDPRTIGHTVTDPDDTKKQVEELLCKL
uniref:Phosphomannomutase n=1 Tax=Heterorhabditis bacteriophora TaxID=37862 RepID=A0A1I7XKU4_HETBA